MEYSLDNKYTPAYLREMVPEDLEELLQTARQKLFELRGLSVKAFGFGMPCSDARRKTRRDIARFLTIIRER